MLLYVSIVDDYNLIKRSHSTSSCSEKIKSGKWQVKFAPVPANIIW